MIKDVKKKDIKENKETKKKQMLAKYKWFTGAVNLCGHSSIADIVTCTLAEAPHTLNAKR